MEDRLAQRRLLPDFCVCRARGLSSCWRGTSYSPGVQLPARALRLRKVQTNSHLQSGLEVSPTSILWKDFLTNSYTHKIHQYVFMCNFSCIFNTFIWSLLSVYVRYSILNILFWFQGKGSRLVQQSLWSPLCCRSCPDPQLLSATNHRRPRDQNLKLFASCVCSALRSRLSLWVIANRQTQSIDRTPELKHSLFRVQMPRKYCFCSSVLAQWQKRTSYRCWA